MTESKMGWLSGWKKIAKYCDAEDIETAKKYAKMGMPVKKLGKKVFIIPADVDRWLRKKG